MLEPAGDTMSGYKIIGTVGAIIMTIGVFMPAGSLDLAPMYLTSRTNETQR